jgi:hypothetical protein
MTLANPASIFCQQQRGILEIVTDLSWWQSWICHLADGTTCDEWAYFRGECPGTGLAATWNIDMNNDNSVYAYGKWYIDPNNMEYIFYMWYVKIGNEIYYKSSEQDIKLDWVDISSFEILLEGDGKHDGFAKDKNNLYLYGRKEQILWLDLSTLQIINHSYIKDKNNVYSVLEDKKIEGADPLSFRIVDSGMARDKDHIIIQWSILLWIDANTFEILWGGEYARDKNHVYQLAVEWDERRPILQWANPKTFVVPN